MFTRFTVDPCNHVWEYDGANGYSGCRYVCVKCKATKFT